MDKTIPYLALAGVVGVGLIGGLLFVFSNFAMRAFACLPEGEGMRAMQEINRAILNPLFLVLFMGTTLVSTASVAMGLVHTGAFGGQGHPAAPGMIAGGLLYGVGVFGVTAGRNVPLNNALDRADPASEAGRALWASYLRVWTRWNHVRVVCAMVSVLAYGRVLWVL
ncbi:MAG: anthrone oxygenase family protein [Planctomycetota bacterium]